VNLPQGARLELVQSSRSPTVISVALSLPTSEKNARLTQKFASNTSLWEILRQFESEQEANYNFTQRGIPEINGTGTGAGRLNYEMPVIIVMPGHKEYSTFVDLQKTLSQLGFDNGSASLRLNFKNSGTPLEEAMTQISQYFKSTGPVTSGAHSGSSSQAASIPDPDKAAPEATMTVAGETILPEEPDPTPMEVDQDPIAQLSASSTDATSSIPPSSLPDVSTAPGPATSETHSMATPNQRNIQVFAAPTSSTPQAAKQPFNEHDYNPTLDQLRGLHTSYKEQSKNTRLLSDRELEEQEKSRQEKLNLTANKGGIVRVRLPDNSLTQFPVSKTDTASNIYDSVSSCLVNKNEPFNLQYRNPRGQNVTIARDSKLVFHDLKFAPSELLYFSWADTTSAVVRNTKAVLSPEWQQKAQALKVEELATNEPAQASSSKGQTAAEHKQKKDMSSAEKENKLKNLLNKSLFKKK